MKESLLYLMWFLSAVLIYTEYCYFWQLKWYRIDRFKDFLSTKQGKSLVTNPYTILRLIIALILFIWWPINSVTITYIIFSVFIADIGYSALRKFKGQYRRPKLSAKAGLILVGSLILEYLVYAFTRDWSLVLLVSGIRLAILSFVVTGIDWATNQIKRVYFKMAEKKLQKFPNIIKIGITGSYGKTSVKELLAQILSHKYKVASTPKNTNSDIGISKFILATDFSTIDVCIVEMGAYNKGDITLVCDIVHPTIGILTAINQQHLSLFGSIENIQKTKYELLHAIPETGLAITNADNALCMEYIKDLKSTVETFGTEVSNNPNCLIESVRGREGKLEATYALTTNEIIEKITVQPKLIGEHQASNIAPCIIVAKHLGMSTSEIAAAVNALVQPEQGIKMYEFGKAIIIDDSYNSNPDGFRAALDILSTFPATKTKIVITRGMHELGKESSELHEKIGNEISFAADELVITTTDFATDLKRGILEKYHTAVKEIFDTEKLIEYVHNLREGENVILIENKIPDTVRNLYIK
ncbi:MAG: UDP-N-acetylmuramoyl-tripeptide--D-alanyl-D-alanine ligase [Candidatus Magasanikbacteria bacterium]|nr:UDP-N-acetylmuramoyl-tripeptide--D-alanyl-D-alanine ligase [Candidatus Magasanikbacteria bacterium]